MSVSNTPSCPHGMQLAAYNICRYCIDEKLAELLALLKKLEGERSTPISPEAATLADVGCVWQALQRERMKFLDGPPALVKPTEAELAFARIMHVVGDARASLERLA